MECNSTEWARRAIFGEWDYLLVVVRERSGPIALSVGKLTVKVVFRTEVTFGLSQRRCHCAGDRRATAIGENSMYSAEG